MSIKGFNYQLIQPDIRYRVKEVKLKGETVDSTYNGTYVLSMCTRYSHKIVDNELIIEMPKQTWKVTL